MLKLTQETTLDSIDIAILQALQTNGRLSNVELSGMVSLSTPATHARVRRLEKEGFIRQYTAVIDREKTGYDLLCFVNVSLQMHRLDQVENFRKATREMPEVLECHHITGEFDYLLKVALHNSKDLERFIVNRLTPIQGVARIHTSIVLSEIKAGMQLHLE